MRKAVFLVLLFFISVMAPLASSATTETQFKGGAHPIPRPSVAKEMDPLASLPSHLEQKSRLLNSISWVKPAPQHGVISPPTTILVVSAVAMVKQADG